MGRLPTINRKVFGQVFMQQMQLVCNQSFDSDQHVSLVFQNLSNTQRAVCWQQLALALNKEVQPVKDFYYNTWIRQFSPDLDLFKKEIEEIVSETICDPKCVQIVCERFTARYKHVQFHMKAVNQFVRKLVSKQQQQLAQYE
ncbi:Conserved_hypothetical protein [Hexamita inflata]|uniref:Uncharacterized protein n=1 Tax=Hexamita inflata TaxID=28002 RepID=A0ABP1JA56_9EUKA